MKSSGPWPGLRCYLSCPARGTWIEIGNSVYFREGPGKVVPRKGHVD